MPSNHISRAAGGVGVFCHLSQLLPKGNHRLTLKFIPTEMKQPLGFYRCIYKSLKSRAHFLGKTWCPCEHEPETIRELLSLFGEHCYTVSERTVPCYTSHIQDIGYLKAFLKVL